MMLTPESLKIASLGPRNVASPLNMQGCVAASNNFVPDGARVRYRVDLPNEQTPADDPLFEKAGPREKIFFQPETVRAAIVTCGGLCPGLNNVVRSVFLALFSQLRRQNHLWHPLRLRGAQPRMRAPAS